MPVYFPNERGELAAFRGRINLLLLTDDELAQPFWQPAISLRNFLQYRVRPAIYFIQYCGLPAPNGKVPDMPQEEYEELRVIVLRLLGTLRHLSRARIVLCLLPMSLGLPGPLHPAPISAVDDARVAKYAVPGEACNMISIAMCLAQGFLDSVGRDRLVFSIIEPILMDWMRMTSDVVHFTGVRSEYPLYQKNGFPKPGVSDDELYRAPEESS
ncbi:hypothetical protein C8R46DRAFT_1040415 [Mycena filopes]|nr:hypothetical protein C8R46DRAFT_1040415 [Mycena filopes]